MVPRHHGATRPRGVQQEEEEEGRKEGQKIRQRQKEKVDILYDYEIIYGYVHILLL